MLTPVQEDKTGKLSELADYGLDGIEEERSTVLTRTGSKANEKSLSKRRVKSKAQPKTVIEVKVSCVKRGRVSLYVMHMYSYIYARIYILCLWQALMLM